MFWCKIKGLWWWWQCLLFEKMYRCILPYWCNPSWWNLTTDSREEKKYTNNGKLHTNTSSTFIIWENQSKCTIKNYLRICLLWLCRFLFCFWHHTECCGSCMLHYNNNNKFCYAPFFIHILEIDILKTSITVIVNLLKSSNINHKY